MRGVSDCWCPARRCFSSDDIMHVVRYYQVSCRTTLCLWLFKVFFLENRTELWMAADWDNGHPARCRRRGQDHSADFSRATALLSAFNEMPRSAATDGTSVVPVEPSVPNAISTLFEGVASNASLKVKCLRCFCHAVNGTLVDVSVSRCSTGGSTGRTGGSANATDATAHANGISFFICRHFIRYARNAQAADRTNGIRKRIGGLPCSACTSGHGRRRTPIRLMWPCARGGQ